MAMQELGQISEVDLWEIWPDEARNFTVWLSEQNNLDLLSAALGLDLEFVTREAPVGPYRLDILAKEKGDGGRYAAIENQLGSADHNHLGKLFTYAAGRQAKILIWVAREFSASHIDAVNWLNQWTQREIECYAVEVHVRQIGDSLPAPEFVPIAVPQHWTVDNRSPKIPVKPILDDSQKYCAFFQILVDELKDLGFTDYTESEVEYRLSFQSDIDIDLTYDMSFDDKWAHVYLFWWGSMKGKKGANAVYSDLNKEKDKIEVDFGEDLNWHKDGRTGYFYVSLQKYASIDDPPEKLAETRAWMLKTLSKFREVFNPRLEKILAELEAA